MALHLEQQVLDTVKAELAAGATEAGTRVHVDRVDPLAWGELPVIVVEESDEGESIEPYTVHGHQKRTLPVLVRCVRKLTADNAAESRAFGLAVEKIIAGSAAIQALCPLGVEITNSRLAQHAQAEHPYAERVQRWQFSYMCLSTTPDVAA